MGAWRRNPDSPALVLSKLDQWTSDKHPARAYYQDMVDAMRRKPNSSVYGDVDLNLLTHSRIFADLPKTGRDVLG
jgi:hypothetical protein